ncbi:MAG: F(420)H(2) dehydrogenase subunit D [Methanomassiliicoccales archaeon PtaU1.Bin124]|nr:MAG: F(420)H(2) dehydrogenase subunit D [Methanomassiliicoccales archaeon PtaU1.Bin124]
MNRMILSELVEDLPPVLRTGIRWELQDDGSLTIDVGEEALPGIVDHIQKKYHSWLISEHALDLRPKGGEFQLIVLLGLPKVTVPVIIRANVDIYASSFHSLTPSVPAANWFEREISDTFGLTPNGHPDQRPLVLYDDWPYGTYPLRKDFDPSRPVPRVPSEYPFRKVEGEGVFEIPVGPVHAGVIEPGHFRFSVAGEPIINLEIRMGYTHRGVEKLSESLPYHRGVPLAERISGDNGFTHALAYCQAVESLAGCAVPDRALFIRTILSEMERLYCHMGDVGGIALDTAFGTGAQMAYILRERLMQLNDQVTGSRFLRSASCLGGVRCDIPVDSKKDIQRTLLQVKLDFDDFVTTIKNMPSFLDRVETTGVLTLENARSLNVVGPVGRGSGIDRDVRRDHPYAAYDQISFQVPVYREGDVWARTRVKIDEVYESIGIIEQALDKLPSGELCVPLGEAPEGRTGLSLTETHRGECMHWLMAGKGQPYRHKVRDASFLNWPAIELAVLGNIVPDFPLVNKSFNLSYAGNDL